MPAVLVARVSSKEQESEGFSLGSQRKTLESYAQRQGIPILQTFLISETASKSEERYTFSEVFKLCTSGKATDLIFEKVDRGTRSLKWQVKFYTWLDGDENRRLHFVHDSLILHKNSRSQDRLNFDMKVVFSKNYSDNLSEEVKKGFKEKVAEGYYPQRAPYGYKNVGDRRKYIEIEPGEAAYVKEAFQLALSGISIKNIGSRLQARSKKGKIKSTSMWNMYLKNVFYTGRFRYKGQIYEGKHPPIIDMTTFNAVQYALQRRRNTMHKTKREYLLQGLVSCDCGRLLSWYEKKGYIYGQCSICKGKQLQREDRILVQVERELAEFKIQDPLTVEVVRNQIISNTQSDITESEFQHRALQQEEIRIEKMRSNAYLDKLRDKITEERFNGIDLHLGNELQQVREKIAMLSQDSSDLAKKSIMIFNLSQLGAMLFSTNNEEIKRKMLMVLYNRRLQLNPEYALLKSSIQCINADRNLELSQTTVTQRLRTSFVSQDLNTWVYSLLLELNTLLGNILLA